MRKFFINHKTMITIKTTFSEIKYKVHALVIDWLTKNSIYYREKTNADEDYCFDAKKESPDCEMFIYFFNPGQDDCYAIGLQTRLEKLQAQVAFHLNDYAICITSYTETQSEVKNERKLTVVVRKIKLKEEKTNRYIYHVSPSKNRASINKRGLLAMPFSKSRWVSSPGMVYPDALFANVADFSRWFPLDQWLFLPMRNEDLDVWRIDTIACRNKWYEDPNLGNMVFTKKNIPRKAIKLYQINCDEIVMNGGELIDGLTLMEYIYAVCPYTGKSLAPQRKVFWPMLEHEWDIELSSLPKEDKNVLALENKLYESHTRKINRQIIAQYLRLTA